MSASKITVSVRFKREQAVEIAKRHGHRTQAEQAAFFGATQSAYSRVYNGVTGPGRDFIAAALTSPAADVEPWFGFDTIFEVVER